MFSRFEFGLTFHCRILSIAVGPNSRYGQLMKEVKKEAVDTPLQMLLATLAKNIGYVGLAAAAVLLVALTIKFVVNGVNDNWNAFRVDGSVAVAPVISQIVNSIILQAVTIIVVAVPEGEKFAPFHHCVPCY